MTRSTLLELVLIARLAKFITKQHLPLLAVAATIAIVGFVSARQLQMRWNVESMFPPGDPLVASYNHLQDRFGGNQIVLAVYRDPQLWHPSGDGLERLEQVANRLREVDGVSAVLSLAELHRILESLRTPLTLLPFTESKPPLLNPDDTLAQAMAGVFEGYTHQHGSEYVAVAVLLAGDPTAEDGSSQVGPNSTERTEVLARLREVIDDLPTPASDGLLTGEPVLVEEGFQMVRRDGTRLGVTSTVLLVIVLLFCFRSIRWTLIPLAVVHWSLIVTQAILVLLDLNLTMISSTLTAVVTVVGVATSMHVLLRFHRERQQGHSRAEALENTYRTLLVAVAWACLTDAIGFASLMVAGVGPVRDFGLMMAVGSLVVLLAIVLVVPGLALVGRIDADPNVPKFDYALRLGLRRLMNQVLQRRRIGLAILAILLAVGVWGSQRLVIETDFTKNFRSDSRIVRGYSLIEKEFGGAGVWDIMLPAPAKITNAYLNEVLLLEEQLRELSVADGPQEVRLTKVLSMADADKAGQSVTLIAALPASARIRGMKAAMPEFSKALLSQPADGQSWLRIMLRSREQSSASAKTLLVEQVDLALQQSTTRPEWTALFDQPPPPAELAGYHVMLGALVDRVLADQWACFLVASTGILCLMLLATRSPILAVYALVPNALPIVLLLGTLGLLGIRMNMGAAMIAAVSLGLSVDSSIHYLLHYQRERKNKKPARALGSAQENVGLAAVLATVALIAGFISLCTSEFVPTVIFGALASLTMLGGLLGNLIVLPLLIGEGK